MGLPREAAMDKKTGWGGQTADRRESFSDIITNAFGAGYSNIPDAPVASTTYKMNSLTTGGNAQKLTASVIVGENGIDQLISKAVNTAGGNDGGEYGLATITVEGPKSGCTVTEVDRGTHESAECSGRGNCDRETGTCICDAGYTLEACSEQTVLV